MFCLPSLTVAREFGVSQKEFLEGSQSASQVSSTVHVLSMLLRLRQCCCHLSLLKVVIALYCSGVGGFVGIFQAFVQVNRLGNTFVSLSYGSMNRDNFRMPCFKAQDVLDGLTFY